MARWLSEPGEDMTRTLEFLDRRIDNVMQIEKLKAQARPVGMMAVATVAAAAKAFSRRARGGV